MNLPWEVLYDQLLIDIFVKRLEHQLQLSLISEFPTSMTCLVSGRADFIYTYLNISLPRHGVRDNQVSILDVDFARKPDRSIESNMNPII